MVSKQFLKPPLNAHVHRSMKLIFTTMQSPQALVTQEVCCKVFAQPLSGDKGVFCRFLLYLSLLTSINGEPTYFLHAFLATLSYNATILLDDALGATFGTPSSINLHTWLSGCLAVACQPSPWPLLVQLTSCWSVGYRTLNNFPDGVVSCKHTFFGDENLPGLARCPLMRAFHSHRSEGMNNACTFMFQIQKRERHGSRGEAYFPQLRASSVVGYAFEQYMRSCSHTESNITVRRTGWGCKSSVRLLLSLVISVRILCSNPCAGSLPKSCALDSSHSSCEMTVLFIITEFPAQ